MRVSSQGLSTRATQLPYGREGGREGGREEGRARTL